MEKNNNYDIIIIGSGIGGLTLASIMAKINKKKVLILERHFQIGGYTHSFKRKKYTWDVGLHYVGRVFDGKLPELLFNFITNKKLEWQRISEPFESFVYPNLTFSVFGTGNKYHKDLIKMFPDQKKGLDQYFRDVNSSTRWFTIFYLTRFFPGFLSFPLKMINKLTQKKVLQTTSEYMKKNISNTNLRSILTSQWGNYGMPPSKSAFLVHAIVVSHFIKGGYYPKGGSEEIAKTIIPIIENSGGNCLANHNVEKILIEKGRAVGVQVAKKTKSGNETMQYHAPVIVSNAGAFNTYTKLIPKDIHLPFIKKCIEMNKVARCVALYIGLKGDAKKLGIKSANNWIYDSYDHDNNYNNKDILEGKPSSCYLSFIFERDLKSNVNTAIIIAYVGYEEFEKWKHQVSGRREKEYYKLKDKISKGMINFVDNRFPGFSKLVDYAELATPLTSEHYTAHPEGAMYGLPATPQRYTQDWLKVETPIKGLYMTGTDVSGLGVVCSMLGGFATACFLNGKFGLFKLMRKIRKYHKNTDI